MAEREVVADATVLIFLATLRRLDLLRDSYDVVYIPTEVRGEVVAAGKARGAADATVVEEAVEAGRIEVHEVDPLEDVQRYELEAGETAVLSLAVERDHDEVLADEESVREVARILGLQPRGTLWFLFDAIRGGDLTFDDFLEHLEGLLQAGFYLDEAVYLEAVRQAHALANEGS